MRDRKAKYIRKTGMLRMMIQSICLVGFRIVLPRYLQTKRSSANDIQNINQKAESSAQFNRNKKIA